MNLLLSLRRVRISTRVVLVGFMITGLFLLTTLLWVLPEVEEALLDRKKEKIKEETEIAWGILDYHYDQAKNGVMSEEAAKTAARSIVRRLRYGPTMKDYFWINDMRGKMLMHPYREDLVGQDLSDLRDEAGKYFIREFTAVCREHGEGFVEYLWQWQDETERIAPKISFVRLFRPWSWIIGTGMYVEDVKAEIDSWKIGIVILFLCLGLVGAILSSLVGQAVAKSVEEALRKGKSIYTLLEEDLGLPKEAPWRLRTFVLVVTIPALALITGVWCADLNHDLFGIIMDGFDAKLHSVSTVTASFIRGEDHAEIERRMNEEDELYLTYVRPMRAILEKAGVTYLYSQMLPESGTCCRYILDASEGEDHSAIGSEEELSTTEYRGAQNVQVHGTVHISEVAPTENWGFLKTAYAPIHDREGGIVGMAGADVNIAAIHEETRAALFTVSLIGVGAILLSVWFSFLISRKLTEPLEALKDGALKLAAGSYDEKIWISQPAELQRLGVEFNKIGHTLKQTFQELVDTRVDLETRTRRHELTAAIDKSPSGTLSVTGPTYAVSFFSNRAEHKTASGWRIGDAATILWIARPVGDPLDAVRRRSDIGLVLERILEKSGSPTAGFVARMKDMYADETTAVFVHIPKEGRLYSVCREPVSVILLRAGSPPRGEALDGTSTVELPLDTAVIMSDHGELVWQPFLERLASAGIGPDTPLSEALAMVGRETESCEGNRQVMAAIFRSPGGQT